MAAEMYTSLPPLSLSLSFPLSLSHYLAEEAVLLNFNTRPEHIGFSSQLCASCSNFRLRGDKRQEGAFFFP